MSSIDPLALRDLVRARARLDVEQPVPVGSTGTGLVPQPEGAPVMRADWVLYRPPYAELPGLVSVEALKQHVVVYARHLSAARSAATSPATERRRWDDAHHVSACHLHDLYFRGLSPLAPGPAGAAQVAIVDRWGSLEAWWGEVVDAGMSVDGWVVTAACVEDRSDLYVFAMPGDDSGLPPGYVPFQAADVHEHAYWMDHGADKEKYLQEMYRFINWEALDERLVSFAR